MIIVSIENIPKFIGLYCNKNIISFESVLKFNKLLCNTIFNFIDPYTYEAYFPQNDIIDAYIDKSKLDRYLNCKYEEELNISKSLKNELFKVKLHGGSVINIYIEDYNYDSNILTLKIEK